jgi:hypothetical protein
MKRLKKMRIYADLHGDSGLKSGRTFLGSVTELVIPVNAKEYALGKGLYDIEPSDRRPAVVTVDFPSKPCDAFPVKAPDYLARQAD